MRRTLLGLLIVVGLIVLVREWSIRRHAADLEDWPRVS
jgi:hypothetical protein